jgi:hypothetical protein
MKQRGKQRLGSKQCLVLREGGGECTEAEVSDQGFMIVKEGSRVNKLNYHAILLNQGDVIDAARVNYGACYWSTSVCKHDVLPRAPSFIKLAHLRDA